MKDKEILFILSCITFAAILVAIASLLALSQNHFHKERTEHKVLFFNSYDECKEAAIYDDKVLYSCTGDICRCSWESSPGQIQSYGGNISLQ